MASGEGLRARSLLPSWDCSSSSWHGWEAEDLHLQDFQ